MKESITFLLNQDATSNLVSAETDLGDLTKYSVHVYFTGGAGNLVGSLKLQASNTTNMSPRDWVDVANSVQAVTASASHMWNDIDATFRFLRVVWTYTSGTGNINTATLIKQHPVVEG